MNKTSVLHAPSWAHQGEYLASGTVWQFAGCVEDTADTTSAEGVVYVQSHRKLKQIATSADASSTIQMFYLGYKWPNEDDYFAHNSLSSEYITDGEGIIGLKMLPGIRIQEYVGTDYTNASGIKIGLMAPDITWSSVAYGTALYFTDYGQLTTATTNVVARARFIELKGDWVTVELV